MPPLIAVMRLAIAPDENLHIYFFLPSANACRKNVKSQCTLSKQPWFCTQKRVMLKCLPLADRTHALQRHRLNQIAKTCCITRSGRPLTEHSRHIVLSAPHMINVYRTICVYKQESALTWLCLMHRNVSHDRNSKLNYSPSQLMIIFARI